MNYSDASLTPERLTALMTGTPDEYAFYVCTRDPPGTGSTSSTAGTTSFGSACLGALSCSSRPTGACTDLGSATTSGATS